MDMHSERSGFTFLLATQLALVASVSYAQTTVPHQFLDGTPARAAEINENFEDLAAAIDGVGTVGRSADFNFAIGTNMSSLTPGVPLAYSGKTNIGMGGGVLDSAESGWGNVGFGHLALASLGSGEGNVAAGYLAFSLGNSDYNVALGHQALGSATPSNHNIGIGYRALYNLTSLNHSNIAIGREAGRDFNGIDSILIGSYAGRYASGSYNTILGADAFVNAEASGFYNAALGYGALSASTSGRGNTAVGAYALNGNMAGEHNTAIGYASGVTDGNLSNATAIGYQAGVDASNKIRLGNADVTVIEGAVGFNAPSDRRLKDNIQTLENGLDLIRDLRPVTYHRKTSGDGAVEMGVIAQELREVLTRHGLSNSNMVHQSTADSMMSVRYDDFIAPLISAIQSLDKTLTEQQRITSEQARRINALEQALGIHVDSP